MVALGWRSFPQATARLHAGWADALAPLGADGARILQSGGIRHQSSQALAGTCVRGFRSSNPSAAPRPAGAATRLIALTVPAFNLMLGDESLMTAGRDTCGEGVLTGLGHTALARSSLCRDLLLRTAVGGESGGPAHLSRGLQGNEDSPARCLAMTGEKGRRPLTPSSPDPGHQPSHQPSHREPSAAIPRRPRARWCSPTIP